MPLKTLAPRIPLLDKQSGSQARMVTSVGTQRIRGRRLMQARAFEMRQQPLCANCLKRGVTRAAEERDHVVPLCEGGRDDSSNTQNLCRECHATKSAAEAVRRAQGG
jgi:5-methylcytosine-specific restriction protein A